MALKEPGLTRYWFEFESSPDVERVDSLRAGCGVTARDYGDALALIRERVCDGGDLPPVRKCVENVDVLSLDPRHVLPNLVMPPIWRGIWFPQGFADWKEQ